MGGQCSKSLLTLGFLTAIEGRGLGLCGGYLVLNAAGRPLEFLCTASVKTNRAQEILFGPTLQAYLYAEQIGQTLVAKAQRQATVVLTDVWPMLELADHIPLPVAMVITAPMDRDHASHSNPLTARGENPDGAEAAEPMQRTPCDGPQRMTLQVGHARLAIRAPERHLFHPLVDRLAEVSRRVDLAEPFERIRTAIREAQRIRDEVPSVA